MSKIYIETSIPSYITAKPSGDLVATTRQYLAQKWWTNERDKNQLYVSGIVLLEAGRGDEGKAKQRIELLTEIPRLKISETCRSLAKEIILKSDLTQKASEDALHISIATIHQMDILLTWNCRHIANPIILKKIRKIVSEFGYLLPEICIPEELLGDDHEG